MSVINDTSYHVDQIKVYVTQTKNGIIINVGVNVKNQIIGFFIKMIIFGILVRVVVNIIKHDIYLDIIILV